MQTGDRIRQKRIEKGFTLYELSQKVSMREATIQRYESGTIKNIPFEKLVAIAEALDCSANYLAFGEEKQLVNDDPELTEYLEELKNRPELKMMFSLTKNATKKDVEKAVAIVEAFLNGSNNE